MEIEGYKILDGATPKVPYPTEWIRATFGPGWPITPLPQPIPEEVPREIQYPPSANIQIIPRTGYGLKPFSVLKEAYENVTEVALPVSILISEILTLRPTLLDPEGKPLPPDHPMYWFTEKPDGWTPWPIFLSRFLENVLVYDAGSLYLRKEGEAFFGVEYIDGSTLFLIIDRRGQLARPPLPAFNQIIFGTPIAQYTQDEIVYRPRRPRGWAPYGTSPIEIAWPWVILVASLLGFEIAWYREGNLPEGVAIAPEGLTWEQVAVIESIWNASMTTPGARRRWRFMPAGYQFQPLKTREFPKDLYEKAREMISLSFGVPLAEMGHMPGFGLGGRGFAEAMQSAFYRMGLGPLQRYIEGVFTSILRKVGLPYTLSLDWPKESIDPDKVVGRVLEKFRGGLITLNQARSELGLDPIPGGDVLFIIGKTGGQVVRLSDYLAQPGEEPPPAPPQTPLVLPEARVQEAQKHCGVCPEDLLFYRAKVEEAHPLDFPEIHHANEVRIVALRVGDRVRPAIFKPISGESEDLQAYIGGPQAPREEAAFLLSLALGAYLVPVSFLARVGDEVGSVQYYVPRAGDRKPPSAYDEWWVYHAAILDFLMGQLDRDGKNWITHPDNPSRPILIDNGFSFPVSDRKIRSSFLQECLGKPIPSIIMEKLNILRRDPVWEEIELLVGPLACARARGRLETLLREGVYVSG